MKIIAIQYLCKWIVLEGDKITEIYEYLDW